MKFINKVIAKQLETDLDMFSIGILSRRPIPKDRAMEILGDVDEVQVLENRNMSERLVDYLVDSYGHTSS